MNANHSDRRNQRWALLVLGSLAVAVVSTVVRQIVYFGPATAIDDRSLDALYRVLETGLIAAGSAPVLGFIALFQAHRFDFSTTRAFRAAAVSNFVVAIPASVFLFTIWWNYGAALVWALLLATGGTVAHGLVLRWTRGASTGHTDARD